MAVRMIWIENNLVRGKPVMLEKTTNFCGSFVSLFDKPSSGF